MNETPTVDFTFFLLKRSFKKFKGEDVNLFFADLVFVFPVDVVAFSFFPLALNMLSAIYLCVCNEDI